ncbi:Uma2 family endonuclease [Kovacikia minuta CCNUW1]|uniref:Uma2 family endonuclease n=1 Tax=Kovacikia minuta TaxID=2931930 RepID=UPI001CCD0760|nr:Uma2 family endonuclease [Kovacikia minuta]UBF27364.1 Uma2 family endonuclease [Kovacikia minuta CCNUW1]
MVATSPQSTSPTLELKGEQRVVIHGLTWQSYQQILTALPDNRRARLIYDQGTLEITMPGEDHDFFSRMIGRFIWTLIEELGEQLGFEIKTMGSTTMDYPDLDKGAEPDEAFYIQNQPQVKGRKVNFAADPPPDIVVEVDITHTDINKNRFYASIGVPEFWRFNGKVLRIYQLQNQKYVEVENSPTFAVVPKFRLYEFLEQCRTSEVQASKSLRTYIQQELLHK